MTCLSWLTDMILNGAENRKHTGMILVDIQKAFDTLEHKILLNKMKCIGFSDKKIKTMKQFNFIVFPEPRIINCAVPQGSI